MNKLIRTKEGIREYHFDKLFDDFKPYRMAVFKHWKNLMATIKIEKEDLMQEIDIQFYRAFNEYDINKSNVAFTTFSTKYINQKLLNLTRNYNQPKRKIHLNSLSLNEKVPNCDDENIEFVDLLDSESFENNSIELMDIKDLLAKEKPNKQKIMLLIGDGYTEREVAKMVGVTPQRVNFIKYEVRKKIREKVRN